MSWESVFQFAFVVGIVAAVLGVVFCPAHKNSLEEDLYNTGSMCRNQNLSQSQCDLSLQAIIDQHKRNENVKNP